MKRRRTISSVAAILLAMAAIVMSQPHAKENAPALAGGSQDAKSYAGSGLILHVDRAHKSLEISCAAIPGYIDAMVMTLPVRDAKSLEGLQSGTAIDFTLRANKSTAYVEDIRVHEYENTAQEPMASRQLQILEAASANKTKLPAALKEGDAVPDFALIDQDGQRVTLSQFAGKVAAVTFIYTRCPLPNFCFRMSNNFGVLHQRFAGEMGKELVLLSVTFDPEHDRPDVLKAYARTWTTQNDGWYFLTGATADVQKVCWEFGMNFWQDEGLMTHSLRTVVMDRKGHIAAILEGNEYSAKQLGDLVEEVMKRPR
ncbi:MAG TPA: SCO family protein [Candidatus Acidoferrales bacterium]|nr:SCO family protein [Candidatus Acidoferrales bacterium]